MDTSGTNFHRSNLLGTLAYFGSPAVALRTQANASSLDSTSLYSRAVMPLDLGTSAIGGSVLQTGAEAGNATTGVLETTATPVSTAEVTHMTVTGPTTGHTETGPTGTTFHSGPVHQLDIKHEATITGDPHWDINGTEWTQQGIPGDTYLVMQGNGVFLSALYGQNGGYDYCTMQDAQLVIPANSAAGITSAVTINYAIYDQGNTIQVTTNGQTTSYTGAGTGGDQGGNPLGDNGTVTFGQGAGAVTVNFSGQTVTVTTTSTETPGAQGTITIDSSWGLGLEITAQGTFDGAGGMLNYLQQGNNINDGQSTLDQYAENNFNLNTQVANGNSTDVPLVINPNGMPGFQTWAQGNPTWNAAFN